jgi:uncharacterized protein
MKKLMAQALYTILLLLVVSTGYAQAKPAVKPAKQAAAPKKEVKTDEEVIRIGTIEAPPAEGAMQEMRAVPSTATVDTVPPPDDELTREVKHLLKLTNSMDAGIAIMRNMLNRQRTESSAIPAEFYDRFIGMIDDGRISSLMMIAVVKIYRDKFTLAEIKELIRFYETPIGKKLAQETPNIANASTSAGEKIGKTVAMEIVAGLQQEGKWKF